MSHITSKATAASLAEQFVDETVIPLGTTFGEAILQVFEVFHASFLYTVGRTENFNAMVDGVREVARDANHKFLHDPKAFGKELYKHGSTLGRLYIKDQKDAPKIIANTKRIQSTLRVAKASTGLCNII